MIFGRMVARRVARILVIILKEKFNKIIVMKSEKDLGLASLGMRVRKKVLEALSSLFWMKKFWTTAITESPTIS